MTWQNILKEKFATDIEVQNAYDALLIACVQWGELSLDRDIGHATELHTIAGRLHQIGEAIKGEEMDLSKQFTKIYDMTDEDFNIRYLGDKLFEMLEWREKNQ